MSVAIYGITESTKDLIRLKKYSAGDYSLFSTLGDEDCSLGVVHDIDNLLLREDEYLEIIVCSQYVNEIVNKLTDRGVSLGKIYFYNHQKKEVVSCEELNDRLGEDESVLYAVYDLSINLPSYDVFTFIVQAERYRDSIGCKSICFIVLPARSNKSSFSMNVFYDDADFNWRVNNLINPSFWALESTVSVISLAFREDVLNILNNKTYVYPLGFDINKPAPSANIIEFKKLVENKEDLCVLKPSKIAIKGVKKRLCHGGESDKKIVVIVIRELEHQRCRNSNFSDWAKFSSELDRSVYKVVLVPDFYSYVNVNYSDFGECLVFYEASVNIHLRLALYNEADICLGMSCGALYPIYFMKNTKAIKFQPVSDDNASNTIATLRKQGLEYGEDPFFRANKGQKLIWDVDTYENISSAFRKLVGS